MENALLVGLSRQMALARELDVIANNVANVSTNGFKARNARFVEYIMPVASAETFRAGDRNLSFVVDKGTPLDMSLGSIERTGNPLDAAVQGDAFFSVQTPAGERYTKAGSFDINGQGQLVTQKGQVVLGENGPITFAPGETNARLSADGMVSTDQGQRGRVKLVRFANPSALRSDGDNLFSAAPGAVPQAAGPLARIEVGAVERSNVKPVLEMTRLVEVQRAYATMAGLMTRTDELRRSAIQRLADTQS